RIVLDDENAGRVHPFSLAWARKSPARAALFAGSSLLPRHFPTRGAMVLLDSLPDCQSRPRPPNKGADMPRVTGAATSPISAGDPRVVGTGVSGNARPGRMVGTPAMARPQLVPSRTDWFDDAACRDADTDVFFPSSEANA